MMGEAIFQFLFKYPPVAFERGRLAFSSGWPGWAWAGVALAAAVLVAWYLWQRHPHLAAKEKLFVWSAQSLTLAILLLLLWRPVLILSSLVPQRNVLAILVDDSASMSLVEDGVSRADRVREIFGDSSPLPAALREKFQVRMYSFSDAARRLPGVQELNSAGTGSRIEGAVSEVYAELRHLPLAGMVVVSDGAQNLPPSSRETMEEIQARKIPIYTLGVGRTELSRDLQVDEVAVARTALPGALLTADVTVRQRGYLGREARLVVREGSRVVASKDLEFGPEPVQTVPVSFTPSSKGIKEYSFEVVAPEGEPVRENNSQSRLVEVQDRSARVLYLEGEPRWEYKFLRRALELDESIRIASLLRTSQNKFYRQGIENEQELAEGLPEPKELFRYEGLIIGSLSASFFNAEQQKSIYDFVSRRGGGVLFLGGREALSAGGYQNSLLADLVPVELQTAGASASFHFAPAKFQLTARGWDKLQLSS
ncbi:MAG TPA: vWA domain-containing protein, partial [Terriglobia bacterium]|nr:vWA domain-containing protein [Terriglobia bacterium]